MATKITTLGSLTPGMDITTIPGFSPYGGLTETSIAMATDPFGLQSPVFELINNDILENADGGFTSDPIPVDPTQLYRFTSWVKCIVRGNGTTYVSARSTDPDPANKLLQVDPVRHVADALSYASITSWDLETAVLNTDVWYLVVYHVHPHDYALPTDHPESGWYLQGDVTQKVQPLYKGDLKFIPSTTAIRTESYLHWSSDPTTHLHLFDPRMEVIDGTESDLSQIALNPRGEWNNASRFFPEGPIGNGVEPRYVDSTVGDHQLVCWDIIFSGHVAGDVANFILPNSPIDNCVIVIYDRKRAFGASVISVTRGVGNTATIGQLAEDMQLDLAGYSYTLTYHASINDWAITSTGT